MTSRSLAVQGAGFGALALATQGALGGQGAQQREVAVQGIGYGPRSTALQGLYPRGLTPLALPGPGGKPRRRPAVAPRRSAPDEDDDVLMFLLR